MIRPIHMKQAMTLVLVLAACATLADVPEDANDVRPLEVGAIVPDVSVKDINGQDLNLADYVKKKPTVLIFYRGSWCPYCNKHLAALADIQDDLEQLGYQLVAVSVDKPEGLKEAAEKDNVGYTLLSDASAEAVKAFGLAYRVGAVTRTLYKGYGIDLEEASGYDHHILPVPAVYVVDSKGIIRFEHANPDYKNRLSTEKIMAAARENAAD